MQCEHGEVLRGVSFRIEPEQTVTPASVWPSSSAASSMLALGLTAVATVRRNMCGSTR
jgi:hypothetical protein